jgi:Fic family protein
MDCEAFGNTTMGHLMPIKGYDQFLKRDYAHYAFVPHPLGDTFDLQQRTYKAVGEAERAIGRLDAAMRQVPDASVLVRPAIYREAVSTSALEGTYAPLAEVIEADYNDEAPQRSYEVREVLNAVRATEKSIELLAKRPICVTVLNDLQQILVQGTRSDGADAGRLRTGQVYIGERRNGIEKSRFVPPPAGPVLVEGMDAWEKWINAEDDVPLIVKVVMGHYQFETLHPYSDGNGRLGRLIILLQLMEAGALSHPVLDLSSWLEPRRDEYKDHLLGVSRTGAADPLVAFMSEGLAKASDQALRRIERLQATSKGIVRKLKQDGARGVALDLVDDLMRSPFITAAQAAASHGVTYPPANNAIQRMVKLGILRQWGERKYGRIYLCEALLSAVNDPLDG